MTKVFVILPLLAGLASCNSPNDPGVGGVTRAEAEALNDAAAMLDNNAVDPVPEPANASTTKGGDR